MNCDRHMGPENTIWDQIIQKGGTELVLFGKGALKLFLNGVHLSKHLNFSQHIIKFILNHR